MKNKLLLLLSFFTSIVFAQNTISFTDSAVSDVNLSPFFRNYTIVTINDAMSHIGNGKGLVLEYHDSYAFTLQENRLYTSDHEVVVQGEHGSEIKRLGQLGFDGKYFSNSDDTATHQMALSVYNNQYTFYVRSGGNEFYIEPLSKYAAGANTDEYVYYTVADIITEGQQSCGVAETNTVSRAAVPAARMQPTDNCKTVELNMCIDYSMYATYGSVNASINRVFEILNLTQLDYSIANGLAFDVNFKLKRMYVLTCMNCNYWPTTTDIVVNRDNFQPHSTYVQMFDAASDIRIFWQDSYDLSANNFYNGFGTQPEPTSNNCSTDPTITVNQVILKNGVTATNGTRKILSHELGHNFSCPHINDFNNIMSGCCYTGNAWNDQSISTINYVLTNSNCYYDCLAQPCDNTIIQNVLVNINQSDSSINASWQSEMGMQYKVRLYNFATSTWSTYTTYDYPAHTSTYSYTNDPVVCDAFKVEIVPVCSGIDGFSEIVRFSIPNAPSPNLAFTSTAQDGNLCSGMSYTFTVSAQYPGTNPIYKWKINNTTYGATSTNFTTSALQNNDVLTCQINSNACLGTAISTVSRTVTVIPQPCSLSSTDFGSDGFTYFPNPVTDTFTIKSITEMERISIYNMLGQKILERTVQKDEASLDLSFLASATYIVKIESNAKLSLLKIVKQ